LTNNTKTGKSRPFHHPSTSSWLPTFAFTTLLH